jgi:hypothetical protein
MVFAGTEVFVKRKRFRRRERRDAPKEIPSGDAEIAEKTFSLKSFCFALLCVLCVLCVSALSASKEVKQKVRTP